MLEPGQNIDGQVLDADGNLISPGTPLAKIDATRFEIAVESAQASWEISKLEEDVTRIRLESTIPSDIESAESDYSLAQVEYDRLKSLRDQNAISQADLETAANRLQTQKSRFDNLNSSLKQTEAELKAAEARTKSALQALRDAQRDLENTTLYASYRGQISEVLVVPGSVVSAGSPVLNLQMMDPIKVEVEVSAEQSREIVRRRQVPISFPLPDGATHLQNAFVYVVDPSADPSTRTFTVTLLILNQQYRPALPDHIEEQNVARSQDLWPLQLNTLIGYDDPGMLFVEEGCINQDDQGDYVWIVRDIRFAETLPDVVKLEKKYVTVADLRVPFLGNWTFRPTRFADPEIDATRLVAGKLEYPGDDVANWDGESLVVDSGPQWRLRPGDLVEVNLGSPDQQAGYFIPVESIYEEAGETFIFVVDGETVKKTRVRAILPSKLDTGSMIGIEPIDSSGFPPDLQIVLGGVHFLSDGDRVNVVSHLTLEPALPEPPLDETQVAIPPSPEGGRP